MALTPAQRAAAVASGRFTALDDIQLVDLVFNHIDADGVMWVVNDVDGWWTIPEPEITDFPRPVEDGSYESRGRYTPRVFTLTGTILPQHPDQVPAARDKLVRAANLCRQGGWFMTHEDDYTKGSLVWLSGAPMIQTVNYKGRTDFSIGLRAPDPTKYALKDRLVPGWFTVAKTGWSTTAAAFSVTNDGNSRVLPTIKIAGPTYGPVTLKNTTTNESLLVVTKVDAGQTLTIDTRDRGVTLTTGATTAKNKRSYLAYATGWPRLEPGINNFTIVDAGTQTASTGTVTIQYRHGWIG